MTDPRVPTETLEEIRKRAERVLRDTGRGLINLAIGKDEVARDVLSLAERVEDLERRNFKLRAYAEYEYVADAELQARAARYEEALREIVKSDDEPSPGYAASPDYYVGLYEQAEIARAVLAASEGTPTPSKEKES